MQRMYLAVVFDDLTGGARLGLRHVGDGLSCAGPADRGDTEISGGDRLDGLGLGGHDPLEARVARLDDPGGDADDGRQRTGDFVVALLRLAVDLQRLPIDLDVLGLVARVLSP